MLWALCPVLADNIPVQPRRDRAQLCAGLPQGSPILGLGPLSWLPSTARYFGHGCRDKWLWSSLCLLGGWMNSHCSVGALGFCQPWPGLGWGRAIPARRKWCDTRVLDLLISVGAGMGCHGMGSHKSLGRLWFKKRSFSACCLLQMCGTSISQGCFSIAMQSMACGSWRESTNIKWVRYWDTWGC